MGSVVISIDAELGWGFHDEEPLAADRVEAGRPGWTALARILSSYEVPATWAVVGHLLLTECDGRHAEHPAPEGWFDRERGTWADRPDLRFGRDLIEDVLSADVDHEIACHSFSHILFDNPGVTEEMARAEIEAAIAAAEPLDLTYTSFVFPRNRVGYLEILPEYGFTCYRSAPRAPSGRIQRVASKLLDTALPGRRPLGTPRIDQHGLVAIPPSLFLFAIDGPGRTVLEALGADPIVRQAKDGIDRAVHNEGVFHIWLHPNNIQQARDIKRIRDIVEYAATRRAETALEIETMASVGERIRGSTGSVRSASQGPAWH